MIESFDFLLTGLVIASQAYLAVLFWRWTTARTSPRQALRAAFVAFETLAAFGYICSFSYLAVLLGISGGLTSWLGAAALGYLIISLCVLVVYLAIRTMRRRFGEPADPSRRRALRLVSGALMAAPAAAIGYGTFIERDRIRLREIEIPLKNLPDDLDGIRILQMSDIHLSPFLSERELERAISMGMETKPDLCVVTGDLISTAADPVDACIRHLARIQAPAGVFGCMGNHERYARAEAHVEAASARVGMRFLRSASQTLRFGGATLNLAGVDHQSHAGGKKYLKGTERLTAPGAFNVLLSHNPDVLPVAARQGWDLVLSGHTHGGQINIEILDQSICPARFVTPYIHGLYRSGAATGFVTRGIGTIGIPTRIGAPPEVPLLRLRKV